MRGTVYLLPRDHGMPVNFSRWFETELALDPPALCCALLKASRKLDQFVVGEYAHLVSKSICRRNSLPDSHDLGLRDAPWGETRFDIKLSGNELAVRGERLFRT